MRSMIKEILTFLIGSLLLIAILAIIAERAGFFDDDPTPVESGQVVPRAVPMK